MSKCCLVSSLSCIKMKSKSLAESFVEWGVSSFLNPVLHQNHHLYRSLSSTSDRCLQCMPCPPRPRESLSLTIQLLMHPWLFLATESEKDTSFYCFAPSTFRQEKQSQERTVKHRLWWFPCLLLPWKIWLAMGVMWFSLLGVRAKAQTHTVYY